MVIVARYSLTMFMNTLTHVQLLFGYYHVPSLTLKTTPKGYHIFFPIYINFHFDAICMIIIIIIIIGDDSNSDDCSRSIGGDNIHLPFCPKGCHGVQ